MQFTVATDSHGLAHARRSFRPELFCAPMGVTPENTNTIIRDLLARRARRAVKGP